MPSIARWSIVVAALAIVSVAAETRAETLLERGGGRAPALPGVPAAMALTLGRGALAALRAEHGEALVERFPLGASRSATLALRRFTPLGSHTRVEAMEADGAREVAMPDAAYFTGMVAGEPDSRAVVIAGADTVRGFVASRGEVFPFGPDAAGTHRTYALGDVDRGAYPPPGAFCVNDAYPELAVAPRAVAPSPAPAIAAAGVRVAQVAIETDRELRLKFPSDQAALDYLGDLLAAASAIYERDVGVRLTFSYIRLWGASPADPWVATSPTGTLNEVREYWLDPSKNMSTIAGPRDLVHFVSGKAAQGGVAYVDVLCSQGYGFAVSQVRGAFDLSSPSNIWDVMVLTHELGHNFGSPHSHCYSPPIDRCYNAEPGCYSGPIVRSRGTIMSYCHLTGGLSSIDLMFGSVVQERIAPSVQAASCLTVTTPPPTATTSSTSSTSRPPTTSTSRPPTTSTSRPATTSSTVLGPSTTSSSSSSTSTSSTTSTTASHAGDGDGDGVPDGADGCVGTAHGDLVDAGGCPVCPCDAMRDGTPWPSRYAYLKCVRGEIRRRADVEGMPALTARVLARQTRASTCGRVAATRCCVWAPGATAGDCRVMRLARCEADRLAAARVVDLGPGRCDADSCTP